MSSFSACFHLDLKSGLRSNVTLNTNYFLLFNKTCAGTDSVPNIPNAPAGQIAGWFAEYTDGLIYLCGGQDSTIHRVIFFSIFNGPKMIGQE